MDVLVTQSIQFASKIRLSHKAVAIRAGQIVCLRKGDLLGRCFIPAVIELGQQCVEVGCIIAGHEFIEVELDGPMDRASEHKARRDGLFRELGNVPKEVPQRAPLIQRQRREAHIVPNNSARCDNW